MIAITRIARKIGSAVNPIVRGPAAISPFGPGREVSDIWTFTSTGEGDIPYREGMEWFVISVPVILRSGLVTIGPACRVSFGTTAPANGAASDTRMIITAAYLLTHPHPIITDDTRQVKEFVVEKRGQGIILLVAGVRPCPGLVLEREIFSITGITICETRIEGQGTRVVLPVPPGVFRFYGAGNS
jgi:hypothetical protein